MEVFYNSKLLESGQFLKVSETQIEPVIKIDENPDNFYTLILHDPDAVGGNYIHWAKINITNNDIVTGNTIIPYKGPAPPRNTGKHHYIFNLYLQNGVNDNKPISERAFEMNVLEDMLNLNKPIFKTEFISENEGNKSGGKRKTNKKRGKKRIKRTKKTRRMRRY